MTEPFQEVGFSVTFFHPSRAQINVMLDYSADLIKGNGGGWCVWTNGREMLQVLSFPSVQEMSAKHTLAALTQLAGQVPAPEKPAKK